MADKSKKKPTTFAGWQKLYPDAIKIEAIGTTFLSDQALINATFGYNVKAKILQNTSTATWTSGKGSKVINRAIVSKLATETIEARTLTGAIAENPQ